MTLVNKNLGYAGLDRTLTLLQIESQRHTVNVAGGQ